MSEETADDFKMRPGDNNNYDAYRYIKSPQRLMREGSVCDQIFVSSGICTKCDQIVMSSGICTKIWSLARRSTWQPASSVDLE